MPTLKFELPIASVDFAQAEGSPNIQIRDPDREAKVAWLTTAVQKGIDDLEAGRFVTLTSPKDIDLFMAEVAMEARKTYSG